MTSKKGMFFLLGIIFISIALITTYYVGLSNPATSPGEQNESENDPSLDEARQNESKQELKIAVSMDTFEYLKLVALGYEFEEYNKHIKLEIDAIEKHEAYEYYKRASQLGDAPDIMLLDNAWINEFAALSYLAQLDDALASTMSEIQVAPVNAQARWNGFQWAVPKEIDPYVIAWNKERFAEHGLEQFPKNTNDLLILNQMLSNSETGQEGLYINLQEPYAFITLVAMLEQSWEDEYGELTFPNDVLLVNRLEYLLYSGQAPLQAALKKGEGIGQSDDGDVVIQQSTAEQEEARDDAHDSAEGDAASDASSPAPSDEDEAYVINERWMSSEFDAWEALNEGDISMMITTVSEFNKHASDTVSFTALPYHEQDSMAEHVYGGWITGKSFAVSSQSDMKKEAFEWIQSVTTADAQIELMNAGGGLPSIITAYERLTSTPNYENIVFAIEHGKVFKAHPNFSLQIRALREQLLLLGSNELTVSEFIDQVNVEWGHESH